MASKKLSREKVRKAGKVLVHSSPGTIEYDQALEIAQQWRLAHVYPINTFQARLRHIAKNIPGSIVAQRLKRMPTIIDKLDRYPDMQLSTMQDIGGVRIIVPTITYRALAKKAAIINAIDIMKGYNLAAKEIQDNQRKNRSYYHIIELNIDRKVVTIRAFSKKEQIEALQEYSRLEQATQGDLAKNVVLVSMSELNKLQEAYPNYFLRMEAFLRRLEAIIDSVA